jgi:hypothetical protein
VAENPAAHAAALRSLALENTAASIGIAPTSDGKQVFGVLMETGYAGGVVTLVCFADGSASIYFSNGGGVIGCGARAPVAKAAKSFVARAADYLDRLPAATEFPLPAVGMVRFYFRTFDGTLTFEALEDDLGNNRLSQSPLFHAGHAVISAIRELNLI